MNYMPMNAYLGYGHQLTAMIDKWGVFLGLISEGGSVRFGVFCSHLNWPGVEMMRRIYRKRTARFVTQNEVFMSDSSHNSFIIPSAEDIADFNSKTSTNIGHQDLC